MRDGRSTANLLLAATCAFACSSCGVAQLHPTQDPKDSIALELRDPDAPVLRVKVGDMEVPLWLDLGDSSFLTLQKSVLDAIKAVPTGDSVKLQGIDGEFEVPTYTVPRVQIGDAVFTNVIAKLDAPRSGYGVSPTERGSLGSGLLKNSAVVIDYPHRRMMLLPGAAAPHHALCSGAVVKFSEKSPVWRGEAVTEADTDYGHVTLWWDTGAQATMLSQSTSHATDRVVSRRFVLGDHDFGPWSFGLLVASLPGFDGMIGDDFFMKHRVCIDYPAGRVVIGD
jgi:hypothetical protein